LEVFAVSVPISPPELQYCQLEDAFVAPQPPLLPVAHTVEITLVCVGGIPLGFPFVLEVLDYLSAVPTVRETVKVLWTVSKSL